MSPLFSTSGKFVSTGTTISAGCDEFVAHISGVFCTQGANAVIISSTCTFKVAWESFVKALGTTASFRAWTTEEVTTSDLVSFQLTYNKLAQSRKPAESYVVWWQALADKYCIPVRFSHE